MLGHLVVGRYGAEGETREHAARVQNTWLRRMWALFRRH
jgi:hypothetical protein